MKRYLSVLLTLLLAATASATSADAAQAAQAASLRCTRTTGVTLVVQFSADRVETGCAAGDPRTGYKALTDAGFSLTYAQGRGQGAICRIDGFPANLPCTDMPPEGYYWAYFRVNEDGDWYYSGRGGGSTNPRPGTVEAWRFQDDPDVTKLPSGPPPVPPADPPAATPTKKPTKAAIPRPTRTPTGAPTASGTPTATASASTTATGTATGAAAPPSSTTPRSAPIDDPATPFSDTPDNGGGPGGLSWVWGLVLLAVLGAAGAAAATRRRRA